MRFAQNLNNILIERKMTRYRLAKELGVHQTTVRNWVDGLTTPKFEMIERIANILEVPTSYLIGIDKPVSNEIIVDNFSEIIDEMSIKHQNMYDFYEKIAENPMVILAYLNKLNRNGRIKLTYTLMDIVDSEEYTKKETEADNYSKLISAIDIICSLCDTTPDEE